MTTSQFRLVLAVLLLFVAAFGAYLGWHFSHQPESTPHTCMQGQWVNANC